MQRLLTLKQSVSTLEDLGFVFSDSEPEFDEDDDESLDLTDEEEDMESISSWPEKKRLEPGELDGLLEDARMSVTFALPKPLAVRPLTVEPPKKKRKLSSETTKAAITPVFDLREPEFAQSSKSNTTSGDVGDAYGEAMHLLAVDAADKGARKKSLRFHTSKIESTSAKRRGARNQAVGGDDDIPYRERQKEKEARLAQEAKKRVGNQGGEDLDDSEPQERTSEKRRRETDSGDDEGQSDADGYYELVKRKNKEKKEQKKVEYETTKAFQ
jgi:U3 small nucleolar RNA-associated protein 3